jgi:hypothetical protein
MDRVRRDGMGLRHVLHAGHRFHSDEAVSRIFLMPFYCEAYEFCEGQCDEQCPLCLQEDADEMAMREHFDSPDGDKHEQG